MPNVIEKLHSEHAYMARLLNALERQVEVFGEGGSPDYDIVQGVLEYFLDFPDLCHHPKEDAIARVLLSRGSGDVEAFRGLEAHHEELGQLARRFSQTVRRVLDEAELPRDVFIRAAREFIDSQRRHMQMEEQHFLPVAETLLDENDLVQLDKELFEREDPVFGTEVQERFAVLREQILRWEDAAGDA